MKTSETQKYLFKNFIIDYNDEDLVVFFIILHLPSNLKKKNQKKNLSIIISEMFKSILSFYPRLVETDGFDFLKYNYLIEISRALILKINFQLMIKFVE